MHQTRYDLTLIVCPSRAHISLSIEMSMQTLPPCSDGLFCKPGTVGIGSLSRSVTDSKGPGCVNDTVQRHKRQT